MTSLPKKYRYRRLAMFGFLVFILLGTLGFELYKWTYPTFICQRILINPTIFVPRSEVLAVCKPYKGHHVLWIFLSGKLKKNLLHQFPSIKTVSFRFYFSNTLAIHITEKTPCVAFLTPTTLFITDSSGDVLSRISQETHPKHWPSLTRVEGIRPAYLRSARINPRIIQRVQHIQSIWKSLFGSTDCTIHFRRLFLGDTSRYDDVYLYSKYGMFKVGNTLYLRNQLEQARHFWQYWQQASKNQTIEYLDLRVPGKIILK